MATVAERTGNTTGNTPFAAYRIAWWAVFALMLAINVYASLLSERSIGTRRWPVP